MGDPPLAKVVLRLPDGSTNEYLCGDAPMTIGRDAECDVQVASRYVSRRHARVERRGDDFFLVDLGSANPMFVNGERVHGERPLRSGDSVRLADVTVEFWQATGDPERTEVFAIPEELTRAKDVQGELTPTERTRVKQYSHLRGTLTIMFTDLEDSTRITTALGDDRAQQFLRRHNGLLREQFAAFDGYEVKGQGDGFMVVFSSARAATRCAIAIQRSLKEHNQQEAGLPVRVRIGMNLGEVITEEDDFFGTAVILAARVASRAHGGEVFISELMHHVLDVTGEFRLAPRGTVKLKGFPRGQKIYSVEWEDAGVAAP